MRKWVLTSEALAKFLACLDADAERAGAQYELIRLALVKFFDWRRAHAPEELADETLNRAMRRVDEGEAPRDLPTYCLGIARFVLRESLRHPAQHHVELEDAGPLTAPNHNDAVAEDERQACFESCLRALPLESRQLIMQYYQDERRQKINNRLALAERMGIPLNALRSRAQRIRDRLEQCVADCRKKNARPAT